MWPRRGWNLWWTFGKELDEMLEMFQVEDQALLSIKRL